ncbi:unnamed protein product [Sphagnum troendelagicum]|uniref:Uncharacterized protein n=1 Tax=Sphagnum troendelagicum TaxID=128251 RepID=A0ABP0UVU9_9BRYO
MAFEVARVHGIIRSNIREDGTCISKATETAGSLVQEEAALSCAKATQLTGAHLSYLPGDLHLLQSSAAAAAACWPDVPSSPLTSSSSPRSTETESIGDDDPLAGLVEQVAQTMLEGDEGLNQRPRRSSTRTHSEASAPSICDMEGNKVGFPKKFSDAWDLLYAAAGEVVRLKRNEQQNRPLSSFPVSRYHQQHVQSQHQPQAFSLQQQVPPSQMGAGGGGSNPGLRMVAAARNAGITSSLAPHCVPPSLNNRTANGAGSGMRAVFLGSGGSGRESSGTGVFLPRCAGNGPELKRKPVCSTVLLPSRIVQVLNLNVDNMSSHPPLPSSFVHSAAHAGKPSPLFKSVLHVNAGPELSLPSEWTY